MLTWYAHGMGHGIMSMPYVWAYRVHKHAVCMTIDHAVYMSVPRAQACRMHEHAMCMSISCAWAYCVLDHVLSMQSARAYRVYEQLSIMRG